MISLDDNIWKELRGAYKTPYDVSVALRQLEEVNDPVQEKKIWQELWEELHHQGDVGQASYLAIPHLIRIVRNKGRVDWNLFGLISTIEIQRHVKGNPVVPKEFEQDYLESIKKIPDLMEMIGKEDWDLTLTVSVLAALAISKGQIELGKVILELEDEHMINSFNRFLENY